MALTPESTEVKQLAPQGKVLNGLRILVAEDIVDNQILINRCLKKNGALVDIVENGSQAVDRALSSDYDLVLMDLQMPIMDGYEATQRLRMSGYTKPIIALTAHALREEKERSFQAGCTYHITKPINIKLLLETLAQYNPAATHKRS